MPDIRRLLLILLFFAPLARAIEIDPKETPLLKITFPLDSNTAEDGPHDTIIFVLYQSGIGYSARELWNAHPSRARSGTTRQRHTFWLEPSMIEAVVTHARSYTATKEIPPRNQQFLLEGTALEKPILSSWLNSGNSPLRILALLGLEAREDLLAHIRTVQLVPENTADSRLKRVLAALQISSPKFLPIDIFGGTPVDRIIEQDGSCYLTADSLSKDQPWEIIFGSPDIDSLLKAKTPEAFAEALHRDGNLFRGAGSFESFESLLTSLRTEPHTSFSVQVRRLYIDQDHLYTLAFTAALRATPQKPLSPDLVTIPDIRLQRYDSTVLKRLIE